MWDLPANTPDNYIPNNQLIPAHNIERRLDSYPPISKEIWGVIIEVKDNIVRVVKKAEISWETKKETSDLYEQLTVEQKLKRIDKLYKLENLDNLLSDSHKKFFIESYLWDIWWKFDENNNIAIWDKIIKKWTEKYNNIITKILVSLKEFAKAIIESNERYRLNKNKK